METFTPPAYPICRLFEARKLTQEEFSARVRRASAKIDQLEDRTAKDAKKLLRTLDREIRDGVLAASDSDQLSRGNINGVIDRAVDRLVQERRFLLQRAAQQAVDVAGDFRQKIAAISGQPAPPTAIPSGLARDLLTMQDEANQAFGDSLRAKIKLEVTQGVADGKTPRQIVQDMVAKRVVTPSRQAEDPSAHGALASVEKMARNDVRQVFNAATFSSAKQAGIKGMLKTWVSMDDARVRPDHIQAELDYAVGGRLGPIPVRQNFIVGGEALMFPRDPKGTPEQTANCRCMMVEVTPDLIENVEDDAE